MLCPYCDKECTDRRGLAFHLARMHKTYSLLEREYVVCNILFGEEKVKTLVQQYIDEEICCDDLVKGNTDITKLLSLLGVKRTGQQEKLTKRYKEKYKSTLVERYGVDNISKLDSIKKQKCNTMSITTGHQDYKSFFKALKDQRTEAYNQYLLDDQARKDQYNKYLLTINERYGVSNVGQLQHVRELNRAKQIKFFEGMSIDERRQFTYVARSTFLLGHNWCSQIEQRFHRLLEKMKIPFKKHVFIDGYNFDLLIGDNLLIEVNGDFWHANPRLYHATDIIIGDKTAKDIWDKDLRKSLSIQPNYKLLVYWEMDINSLSDNQLFEKLIEDIYNVEFGNIENCENHAIEKTGE